MERYSYLSIYLCAYVRRHVNQCPCAYIHSSVDAIDGRKCDSIWYAFAAIVVPPFILPHAPHRVHLPDARLDCRHDIVKRPLDVCPICMQLCYHPRVIPQHFFNLQQLVYNTFR